MKQFESGAAEVLASLKSRVSTDDGEMKDPVPEEVQILLMSEEDPLSLRSLGVSFLYLKFSGPFFFFVFVNYQNVVSVLWWYVGTIHF